MGQFSRAQKGVSRTGAQAKAAKLRGRGPNTPEKRRIKEASPTHVLVAVLAFAGPDNPPLPAYRFVWNLAGGNREAATWSADEIRSKAKLAIDYDNEWSPVAD